MSVYDTFQEQQKTDPTSGAQAPASQGTSFFGKIKDSLSSIWGGPVKDTPVPKETASAQPKSVYDTFKSTLPKEAASTEPKSVYDTFKETTATKKDPYFYAETGGGGAIGKGEGQDKSGRPFLGYRNPGDTATTTDKTRVATTFDPREAKPLTKDEYYNPRAEGLRNDFNSAFGIKPSEELDHAIALTVGGSNDVSNLRAIPKEQNQAAGQDEGKLAQLLKEGKISYFDAQVADAKKKGVKIPWTPEQKKNGMEKLFEDTWNHIKHFFTPEEAHADNTPDSPHKGINELLKEGATLSHPRSEDDSFDVHDSKGNYVETFKGKDAYDKASARIEELNAKSATPLEKEAAALEDERAKLDLTNKKAVDDFNAKLNTFEDKVKNSTEEASGEATLAASNPLGEIGRVGSAIYKTAKDTIQNTTNKIAEALEAGGDEKATPGDRASKLGGAMLSAINFIPPIFLFNATLAAAKETTPGPSNKNGKQLPSIQSFASGVETLFQKIAQGSKKEVDTHLEFLVDHGIISPKASETLEPIATEVASLVNMIGLGKVAELSPKIANKTVKMGKILEAEWKEIPNKQGGFVSVGGKEEPVEVPKENNKKEVPETAKDIVGEGTDLKKIEENTGKYITANESQLVADYEAKHGNVYNVDNMKELVPGHAENRTLSEAFHKPAAELVGKMVEKAISEPAKPEEKILIYSGATASGKTSAVESLNNSIDFSNDAKAVIDGTMADNNRSLDNINKSLKNGYDVNVLYVENTPKRILQNAIDRAISGGRSIPVETIFNTLQKSRHNIFKANGRFGNNPKFNVYTIDNRSDVPSIKSGIDLLRNKMYTQDEIERLKKDAYAHIKELYDSGTISEKVYKGFTRRKSPSESGGSQTRPEISRDTQVEHIDHTGEEELETKPVVRKSNRQGSPEEYDKPEKKSKTFSEDKGGVIELHKYKNPIEQKIEELTHQIEFTEDAIKNNPARELSKYARNGKLPEVLGSGIGHGVFKTRGDDIVTELGYEDSDTARAAFENYKLQQKRLESLKIDLRKIKTAYKNTRALEGQAKQISEFLEKAYAKQGSEISNNARIEKPKETLEALNRRKKLAREHLQALIGATYNVTSPLERETPQHLLNLTEDSYRMSVTDFDKMNAETSFPKLVEKYQTPLKKKIGALDYLRTPDRVLRKMGLPNIAGLLRHSYESYLNELPLHIDMITKWSKEVDEKANEVIFDFLDGQLQKDYYAGKIHTKLTPNELKVAMEIKKYLAHWADRLGLPEDQKISHYITHIFGIGENETEFDEDVAKIIDEKVTKSVYDPFLEKRLGAKGYRRDTWAALDAYVKRAVRKANMDPVLERLSKEAERMELSQVKYIKRLTDRINMRPTEIDSALDNTIKSVIGYYFGQRPVAVISRVARQLVFSSSLGLNFGSAMRNLTQGVNTYAKLGEKYTAIGYTKFLTLGTTEELNQAGILGQDQIQDRVLSSTRKNLQRADKALFFAFELAEKINRGAAYYGAKAKAMDEGKSELEAMEYGKKIVRDTQFMFGSIDTPVAMNSDIVKVLTQFMSYGVKQTEFAAEMISNKEWAGIIRYIVASAAIVLILGKILNLKASDFIPGYSFLKFGTPPALAFPKSLLELAFNTPDKFGNSQTLMQHMTNIGGTFPLPASVQIKKTIGGIKALTADEPAKKVEKNPYNYFKALVLGTQNLTQRKEVIQKIYDQVQIYKTAGKTAEAQALVNALSDDDYSIYSKIKTADKAVATKELKSKIRPVYDRVQKLKNEGRTKEAEDIVKSLTDDEYRIYNSIKKLLNP